MASPFVVNVAELRRAPGQRRPHHIEEPVEWGVELTTTKREPRLRADLTLEAISGGIMVEGEVAFRVQQRCNRCLREWEEDSRLELRQLVADDASSEYPIETDDLDLEPLVRDEVILSMPLLALCREDCQGLCPQCGGDLNTGACSGHGDEISGPFAGLRELLEPHE